MVQLIYLIYDPKHPTSDQAAEYEGWLMEKAVKCAAGRGGSSWVTDFLR
jgi:hypothetical protein